jgi:hypothetical protein
MFLRQHFLDENGNGGGLAALDKCSLPHTCSPVGRAGAAALQCCGRPYNVARDFVPAPWFSV